MPVAEASSFRDNSGFVFREGGVLYRQINEPYRSHWECLNASGLANRLIEAGLLIPHEVLPAASPQAIALLRPEEVRMISYPYEWSFSQLKDAALCTLEVQNTAFEGGMVLKDASAYNIQFRAGKPILIDTLSFEIYEEWKPWKAYRQFCRHFLAPLALMAHVGPEASSMLRDHIDGLPLGFVSRALPGKTRFKPGLAMHLHMHAKAEAGSGDAKKVRAGRVSKFGLMGLIESLRSSVQGLSWQPEGTTWADYYSETNYSDKAMARKHQLVAEFLDKVDPCPRVVWDIGANTGEFSKIAAERAESVVSWDIDPAAVERHYLIVRDKRIPNVLPLLQDLTNPSPGLGWDNAERESFVGRANADVVLALALVHHLAIGNNVPLPRVFQFFAKLGKWLIVEFVPKEDSQTQRLLAAKDDIFDTYTREGFENSLEPLYRIHRAENIEGSLRTLYLLERR